MRGYFTVNQGRLQSLCCLVTKSRPALLQPRGLELAWLLCPWDFLGKNTGVGYHSFLQGSSQCRDRTCVSCTGRWWILYHMGSPLIALTNHRISGVQQKKFIFHSVQGRGSWCGGSSGIFLVSSDSGIQSPSRPASA